VLREVAEAGAEAFYRGPIADAIVAVLAEAGGLMQREDLAAHQSTFELPIAIEYRGHTVYECRPSGQGITTLIALNLLEGFELATLDPLSAEHMHYLIEAMRLAFEDARAYVADPSRADVPIDGLLSKAYGAERRALISRERAATTASAGAPARGSDTVYLAAVDADGNGCSFINSVYQGFGSGIVPQGTGFPLHNRGSNFSLDPAHPNALAGLKRPYHTIIPALSTYADGSLHAVFGVKGAFTQPQGQVQVFVQMVDHGLDPQAALDVPRFCLRPASAAGAVYLETGVPEETLRGLEQRGHSVVPSTDRFVFGTGQAIWRDPTTGAFWGGTDPRADGAAIPALG
jgi:gamma-glutamyltranspeptidase/glutathione hydrolase